MSRYAIRFDFPDTGPLYAADYKGALGWAPSLETALIYDTPEQAGRILANGYPAAANVGVIIDADTGQELP